MYFKVHSVPVESEVGSPAAEEDIQVGWVEGSQAVGEGSRAVGEGSRAALEGRAAAAARRGWEDRLGSGVVGKRPGKGGDRVEENERERVHGAGKGRVWGGEYSSGRTRIDGYMFFIKGAMERGQKQ